MRPIPRRAALTLVAVALALPALPSTPVTAADPTKCFTVPAVYVQGRPTVAQTTLMCVPWPL